MPNLITSIQTVGVRGANSALEPTRGLVNAWLKHNGELKYCISNEHICAEIARFIGLPIPPSGIMRKPGGSDYYFASLNFNLTASDLPPIDADRCVRDLPFLSAGVILFDMLVANADRHRKNLSIDTSATPPQLSVFDHSHALFGHENGQGHARLTRLEGQFAIGRHCLVRTIKTDSDFPAWISRISGLPNYLIDEACDATVTLNMITSAEAGTAKKFLKERKSQIESIIRANKSEFTAITQWSLLQ